MKTFPTVEDYLEVIAGLRDPVTLKSKPHSWLNDFDPIVNLARYDTDVLNSMSTTANEGRALTEKQGELAVKIVVKYKRQLVAKGVDVAPVEENPVWRLPLRKMDYTRKLDIANDMITVMFPFNNSLIDGLRDFRKESQGHGEWDKERKVWSFALTEYNLVWLKTWAEQNQFEITNEVLRLDAMVAEVEKTAYAIELRYVNGELTIANCPETLQSYINTHLGGVHNDNLFRLVDMSPVLGYTVSNEIADMIVAKTSPREFSLITNRELKVNPESIQNGDNLASVLDYADLTQRWPVVIYEPDLSGKLLAQLRTLREGVVEVPRTVKVNERYWDNGFKYIHVVAPVTNKSIPLLISSAGMMYGGDKSLMVQNSEKIVYCAAEVYNKKPESKVEKLADL
jgi:hypothetical protein